VRRLEPLLRELDRAGITDGGRPGEWALIGGVVLYLHGLRRWEELGDVDLVLYRGAYDALLSAGWVELMPRATDPPMLEGEVAGLGKPVHAWWKWDAWDPMNRHGANPVTQVLEDYEVLGGVQCETLEHLRDWKHGLTEKRRGLGLATREKDLRDVEAIDVHVLSCQCS
jgi:hypothetical protein